MRSSVSPRFDVSVVATFVVVHRLTKVLEQLYVQTHCVTILSVFWNLKRFEISRALLWHSTIVIILVKFEAHLNMYTYRSYNILSTSIYFAAITIVSCVIKLEYSVSASPYLTLTTYNTLEITWPGYAENYQPSIIWNWALLQFEDFNLKK